MKRLFALFIFSLTSGLLLAQLNMTLAGKKPYGVELNDVWAWVAPDGTEYALVGTETGVSVVSLSDPSQPTEVAFVEGPSSRWRDIKTWEDYAYVSNETGGGLQIIDLKGLPNTVRDTFWSVDMGERSLKEIHNLYIDSSGYCYLAGANINRGGPLILDVDKNPWNPEFVGPVSNTYAHDVYVRGNLLYSSELKQGRMAIYEISDKRSPLLLGIQQTPYKFTHNIWLSDDGKVAFTTDELLTAPVTSYDISDPTNIVELDQFRPAATLAQGNIPHNVHVWRDWLIISYYGDGGIIVDASRPANLVEVGNFDTFFNLDAGQGAWGAYPFLPSGLVLVTDMGNGLFVLEPNYVRAAWLEGKVTDAVSGAGLNGVRVEILSELPNTELSDLRGDYATGQALPGTFDVRFFKQGYLPKIASVTLENGELTILDVELTPASLSQISGITLLDEGGATIEDAQILLTGEQGTYQEFSDAQGLFQINGVYEGTYQLYVGKWGFEAKGLGTIEVDKNMAFTVELRKGYQDEFVFDFGWQSTAVGKDVSGAWVRGEPIGTYGTGSELVNPEFDVAFDLGELCYQTGNRGGSGGTDDVDNGPVILTSPPMDLTDYEDPVLTYYAWFNNFDSNTPANDALLIQITNGTDTVTLEDIQSDMAMGAWRPEAVFHVQDYVELTDSVRLILTTSDFGPSYHWVEAALDLVRVREQALISGVEEAPFAGIEIKAFPNPFRDQLQLDLSELPIGTDWQLEVVNQLGQALFRTRIPSGTALYTVAAENWPAGVYFVRLRSSGTPVRTLKVIKDKG